MKDFLSILDYTEKDLIRFGFNVFFTIMIFLFARFVLSVISKYTALAIEKAEKMEDKDKGKRIVTTMTMTRSIFRYAIYFFAISVVLNQFGYGTIINNMLVTAGIGTLAISFGAQSVVQDVVTGLFLMFEKQYSVGDFVKIGEYEGTVMAVSMRVTYINSRGKKIIIPNGKVSTVVNYSSQYTIFDVVIPTAYEANTKEVMAIMSDELDQYYENNKGLFFDKPEVIGVTAFSGSSVDVTIRGKCVALKHWETERAIRLSMKERFDKEGITIPYSQVVVHNSK